MGTTYLQWHTLLIMDGMRLDRLNKWINQVDFMLMSDDEMCTLSCIPPFSEKRKRTHRCPVVFRLQRRILQVASAQNVVQPGRMLLLVNVLLNVETRNSRESCFRIVTLSEAEACQIQTSAMSGQSMPLRYNIVNLRMSQFRLPHTQGAEQTYVCVDSIDVSAHFWYSKIISRVQESEVIISRGVSFVVIDLSLSCGMAPFTRADEMPLCL